jgi:hypothetical protein
MQNLGHYLEGQGHSMTLQQYRNLKADFSAISQK